jgi:hypothetical protein
LIKRVNTSHIAYASNAVSNNRTNIDSPFRKRRADYPRASRDPT